MLATIEDEGSNTEINIWDLTEQTSGVISTTPLATVDLSAAATPTSIAACMGYIIVGSEDGTHIIDPHSGAWAERTKGWPRTLTASTTPALDNASVNHVAAGYAAAPAHDPRTGGPMPTFGVSYGAGTVTSSILKDDGNVFSSTSAGTTRGYVAEIANGYMFGTGQDENQIRALKIDTTIADYSAAAGNNIMRDFDTISIYMPTAVSKISVNENLFFGAASAANVMIGKFHGLAKNGSGLGARITRTYNTGLYGDSYVGVWLANSKTADYSKQNNTLTENGTVTEAVVESGAELKGYNDFSASNWLSRAFDADFDFGTGSFSISCWVKANGTGTGEYIFFARSSASHGIYLQFRGNDSDKIRLEIYDGTSNLRASTSGGNDDNTWHHIVAVFDSSGATDEGRIYRDGVLEETTVMAMNTLTDSDGLIGIGALADGSSAAVGVTLALARITATGTTATEVREMYDAEKGMFVASAECLLQSGSTDAVLDVDVDPLTNKVIVTQTDAITIFDGLVVDSKPTVNSGASEKGKLWGDLRAEQNAANAYVTAPATDQRQVNEMVRGLASDLPEGPDLGKASAWCSFDAAGQAPTILGSYNIKSITDHGAGDYSLYFAIPFKTQGTGSTYAFATSVTGEQGAGSVSGSGPWSGGNNDTTGSVRINFKNTAGSLTDDNMCNVICFGELENE
jgi:hypothetical protein